MLLHSVSVAPNVHDVAVVEEPVDEGGGHLTPAEPACSLILTKLSRDSGYCSEVDVSSGASPGVLGWHLRRSSSAGSPPAGSVPLTLEEMPFCVVGLEPAPWYPWADAWNYYDVVTIVAYRLRKRKLSRPLVRRVARSAGLVAGRRRKNTHSWRLAYPVFRTVGDELSEFLTGHVVVTYAATFLHDLLSKGFRGIGRSRPAGEYVSTLGLVELLYPKWRPASVPALRDIARYIGVPCDLRRALSYKTRLTARIFLRCLSKLRRSGVREWSDFLECEPPAGYYRWERPVVLA